MTNDETMMSIAANNTPNNNMRDRNPLRARPVRRKLTYRLEDMYPCKRDDGVEFHPFPDHTYFVPELKQTLISVTTIVSLFFEPFNAQRVIECMMRARTWPSNKYNGQTAEEIQATWATNGREASERGTRLHAAIECYYNHGDMTSFSDMLPTSEYAHFQRYVADEVFSRNALNDPVIPYRTEWTVYDETANIGGTIDMVYKNVSDSTYTLVDWKRCKQINKNANRRGKGIMSSYYDCNFTKYSLQLQMYRYILENTYGLKIRDMRLVVLHPLKNNYEVHAIDMDSELYTSIVPQIFQAMRAGGGAGGATNTTSCWSLEELHKLATRRHTTSSCHSRSDSWDTGNLHFLKEEEEEEEGEILEERVDESSGVGEACDESPAPFAQGVCLERSN